MKSFALPLLIASLVVACGCNGGGEPDPEVGKSSEAASNVSANLSPEMQQKMEQRSNAQSMGGGGGGGAILTPPK